MTVSASCFNRIPRGAVLKAAKGDKDGSRETRYEDLVTIQVRSDGAQTRGLEVVRCLTSFEGRANHSC